jgi:hypothetical protein
MDLEKMTPLIPGSLGAVQNSFLFKFQHNEPKRQINYFICVFAAKVRTTVLDAALLSSQSPEIVIDESLRGEAITIILLRGRAHDSVCWGAEDVVAGTA